MFRKVILFILNNFFKKNNEKFKNILLIDNYIKCSLLSFDCCFFLFWTFFILLFIIWFNFIFISNLIIILLIVICFYLIIFLIEIFIN
jgi:hypothetical protein